MLKKVAITNVQTGRTVTTIVDTDTDEKAELGSGHTPSERVQITSITGLDETIQRMTSPKRSMTDRASFFNGIAKCFERNLPAVKSFQLQANRMKSPRFRGVIADMCHDVSMGEKISDAMAKHDDVFTPEILALVRAGEESGQLPAVFRQVATSQRKNLAIIRKLKGGMIYPGIVLTLGVAVVLVMSFTLVPAMVNLYNDLKADLPIPTVVLMRLSEILLKQPYLAALPVVGLVLLFKNWGRIAAMEVTQKLFDRIPVVNNIVRKAAATVGFRTLYMLVEANVRLSTALQITADGSTNYYYRQFFTKVHRHIQEGRSLQESFMVESHWLGNDGRTICGVMEVAGETGTGTGPLREIADDYEEELDLIASQIDRVIEPFTILILGGMVGALIYAIYGPIFSLGDTLLPGRGGD
ncbi:MAG: type II secretion system F family protein [Verrucomicrobiota bacterium]